MLKINELTLTIDKKTILKDLTHTFEDGAVTAIVGASGIGKTTLLRSLSGLLSPSSGEILSSYHKPAFVFQEPRLFPWMSAFENVRSVCGDQEIAERYLTALLSDINDHKKYPHELSGGMKQRVSLARALAYSPDLLLIDEPFKGLDEETRASVLDFFFKATRGTTTLMVTHDRRDLFYCDTVLKLVGAPADRLVLEKSNKDASE